MLLISPDDGFGLGEPWLDVPQPILKVQRTRCARPAFSVLTSGPQDVTPCFQGRRYYVGSLDTGSSHSISGDNCGESFHCSSHGHADTTPVPNSTHLDPESRIVYTSDCDKFGKRNDKTNTIGLRFFDRQRNTFLETFGRWDTGLFSCQTHWSCQLKSLRAC